MSAESFSSSCSFYDAVNFPHGFARAGVFTRMESDLLTSCGYVIKQLASGALEPQNADQARMLAILHGERQPESSVEKTWIKYLNEIGHHKVRYTSLSASSSGIDFSEQSAW